MKKLVLALALLASLPVSAQTMSGGPVPGAGGGSGGGCTIGTAPGTCRDGAAAVAAEQAALSAATQQVGTPGTLTLVTTDARGRVTSGQAITPITNGGTGGADAPTARTNLGAAAAADLTAEAATARAAELANANAARAASLGPLMCGIGDSQVANNLANGQYWARGWLNWARVLSNERFSAPASYISGVPGETSTATVSRMDAFVDGLPVKPTACFYQSGGNDLSGAVAPSVPIANYKTFVQHMQARGIKPVLMPPYPRGAATWATQNNASAGNASLHKLAQSMREYAAQTPGVWIIDGWRYLSDPTSTTGYDISAYFIGDDLHANSGGSFLVALDNLATINALFPIPRVVAPRSSGDLYDATYNQTGSLMPNPMMQGTSGASNNVTAVLNGTATVANGYRLARQNGSTATGTLLTVTKEGTRSDGLPGDRQVLTVDYTSASGGSDAEGFSIYNGFTTGSWAAGDQVFCTSEFSATAQQSAYNVSVSVSDANSVATPTISYDLYYDTTTGSGGTKVYSPGANKDYSGTLQSGTITLAAGSSPVCSTIIYGRGNGTLPWKGVYKVSAMKGEKVIAP